jgi:hypothetical protein
VPGVTDDSRLQVALEAIEDARGRLGPTYAALSFAIGRTAQLHIDAELVLRGMVTTFVHQGLLEADPSRRRPQSFLEYLRLCREGFRNADLPEDGRTAVLAVLAEGEDINQRRNRVVHDRWVERSEDGENWLEIRLWPVGRDVAATPSDILAVVDTMRRTESYASRLRVAFDFLAFYEPGLKREWTSFTYRPLAEVIEAMRR